MIHMFWEDCNEPSFQKHICKIFIVKKMQGVMSLQRARIHKKEEPKRLNNLSGNFVEYFYKD